MPLCSFSWARTHSHTQVLMCLRASTPRCTLTQDNPHSSALSFKCTLTQDPGPHSSRSPDVRAVPDALLSTGRICNRTQKHPLQGTRPPPSSLERTRECSPSIHVKTLSRAQLVSCRPALTSFNGRKSVPLSQAHIHVQTFLRCPPPLPPPLKQPHGLASASSYWVLQDRVL